MSISKPLEAPQLAAPIKQVLDDFLQAARNSFGADLRSVVLYGSAAEGKLRATSDVNLILVLSSFERSKADLLRGPLRIAQAAIELRPMFLLKDEIAPAARSFASKFADILRRRSILFGDDPFVDLSIPREIEIAQLRQQLWNLSLRFRASYVARSLREEQLAVSIAESAGPLRSCAAALLELEGQQPGSPQQALEKIASVLAETQSMDLLLCISQAQETRSLAPGKAAPVLFQLMDLAERMQARAAALS